MERRRNRDKSPRASGRVAKKIRRIEAKKSIALKGVAQSRPHPSVVVVVRVACLTGEICCGDGDGDGYKDGYLGSIASAAPPSFRKVQEKVEEEEEEAASIECPMHAPK